ncbi:PKD domain-containing protein [Chishuiella sp.]|uniref:PKD domain-containing protein n=1 Tax=Chishuiella sp. TaxID=1969467 RepID=UPI0028B1E5E5|nr:PKD domain-containing protein [Chishuiella sp.]
MKYSKIVAVVLGLSFLQSCSEDETTIQLYDSVKLNSSYSTKVDVQTYIKPNITGFPLATYTWTNLTDGNTIISNQRVLSYTFTTKGNYKLQLDVESQKTGEIQKATTTVVVK